MSLPKLTDGERRQRQVAYTQKWRAKNVERLKAYDAQYNKGPIKLSTDYFAVTSRKNRAENPIAARKAWDDWEARNPNKMREIKARQNAKRRAFRAAHPRQHLRRTPRLRAMTLGQITYRSDRPCIRGHLAPRYTQTGLCTECYRSVLWPRHRARHNYLIALRRARQYKATPRWLTSQQLSSIKSFYERSVKVRQQFKIAMSVDHIVPINHPLVCGLHVPWNLQLLSRSKNSQKSNGWEVEIREFA